MKKSLGLIELKSIPMGIKVADEMLKSANIEIIFSTPICPGKYVIMIIGKIGDVKAAVKVGESIAEMFLVESHVLANIDEAVIPAFSGTCDVKEIKSIGVIETISAISAVIAGDIAVKSSKVEVIDIRIARGLGGKGIMMITGEVSSVKMAIDSCLNELKDSGSITSHSLISSPHKDLINSIY